MEIREYYMNDNAMDDVRIENTSQVWDRMAIDFFERNGWTKDHMAYDTDRGTGTLWVMTESEPELWEDTGISAKEGDRLLCEAWDEAEEIGYTMWLEKKPDITVYRSEMDGHWVVEIDTPEMLETNEGPVMRIYLNGGQIYNVGEDVE